VRSAIEMDKNIEYVLPISKDQGGLIALVRKGPLAFYGGYIVGASDCLMSFFVKLHYITLHSIFYHVLQ